MRILLSLLFVLPLAAQNPGPSITGAASGAPATPTISVLTPVSATSSPITTPAGTSSGDLIAIVFNAASYTSTTTTACPGGWVHPSSTATASVGGRILDWIYCLNAASGANSVAITASSLNAALLFVAHSSVSGHTWSIDSGAVPQNNGTSSASNPPGIALTLAGTNDICFQAIIDSTTAVTAVSSPYGNMTQVGSVNVRQAAYQIGNSGSAPTWTVAASVTSVENAIAFTLT